jgi:hypothetical protein
MTTDDSTDTDMPRLAMVAYILILLIAAFLAGAWTMRSDANAKVQISSEVCKAGEVAYLSRDGAQTLCLRGSQRAGGARR